MRMNRSLAGMIAAVALIASNVAIASAATPHGFYGVTPQTKLTRADFREMGRGNVGTLRYEVSWADLDPAPATEAELFTARAYNWWAFDPLVYLAAERGIRILPTIYGTPHWVATLQDCWSNCHKLGPNTIGAYITFSRFMTAAAKRYGKGGEFWDLHPELTARPIRIWQIWNEQNSSDYWKPGPNVTDYANLVIAGGEAVHAVDPGARVILGGMIGEPAQEGKKTVSGWDFLRDLYANPRAREAFDGIAVHPYGASIASVRGTLGRWRKELKDARALGDPIYVTEIGWASGGGKHPLNRGVRGQAQMIDKALTFFTAKRKRFNIANVDIYAWRDAAPGADQCQWCAKSGMLRYERRRPKPAWRAFTSFTKRR